MSNAISKIKIKLLNKNFRAVLYLIYFIFLYIIARFIALHIQLYNFEFVSDLHKSLIEIEVNILEMYFNYLDLLKYVKENTLVFTNDNSIIVLSGCSGLDPMFRILFIVLCFPGPIRSKIWYIPFSLLLVLLAAIIHLIILSGKGLPCPGEAAGLQTPG